MCESLGIITSTKNIKKTVSMARMNFVSFTDYEEGRVNDTALVFTPHSTEHTVIVNDEVWNEYTRRSIF